ncbi:helix-turn-helix domain-containing protein [Gemmobacter lutimaris]|jgi:hypothetical protein|nr:helix-turn-helix transcriptional regulator [Gemmobacter lutimaris]
MKTTATTRDAPNTKRGVIRDAAFAHRLEEACQANPHCPTDLPRGKQKWVYDTLAERHGISVSAEAARKWFSGETRPNPRTMRALADILGIDEGWLSLGLKPDIPTAEKGGRFRAANGAVNLVSGMIQVAGGHVATNTEPASEFEFTAIVNGHLLTLEVRLAHDLGGGKFRFTPNNRPEASMVIGVIPGADMTQADLLKLGHDQIKNCGDYRGDFYELIVTRDAQGEYSTILEPVAKIRRLDDLT